MTNLKQTKNALLTSAVSLLLCFVMLLGSTYAWFTDTAVSKGNKIQAGTLEVDLLMAGKDGEYASISGKDAAIFGIDSLAQDNAQETLWEPGKTQIVYLAVQNKGKLDLKYNIALDVVDGGLIGSLEYAIIDGAKFGDLVTYTDWATLKANAQTGDVAAGKTVAAPNGAIKAGENAVDYFALAVHMKEDAGNEYKGKDITIDVTVLAAQLASEEDSFGSDYDKDALYAVGDGLYIDEEDGSYVAMSTEGLSSAAALASKDSSITSVKYVTDAGEVEVPIASDDSALDTAIKASNEIVVLTDGNYIIPDSASGKTLTFVGTGDTVVATQDDGSYEGCDYSLLSSNVTFEGIVINTDSSTYTGYAGLKATYNNCTINGAYWLYGESEFNNCTFNVSGDNYNIWTWGAGTATFNGCTFNTDGKSILVYTSSCDVYVNNCIFNDRTNGTGFTKSAIETGADDKVNTKHNIYITNTTVNGFAENDKCVGYENVVGNKDSLTKDNLNIVIDRVDVY